MATTVPAQRGGASLSEILASRTVRAPTMIDAALLSNYVLGRGAQLVPFYYPGTSIAASGSATFYFRVRPRYQAVQRLWSVLAIAQSGVGGDMSLTPDGGGTTSYEIAADIASASPISVADDIASQSDTEAAVSIQITAGSSSGLTILGIGCRELPRVDLVTSANDLGTDTAQLIRGQPIKADVLERMRDAQRAASEIGRRVSLLQYSDPSFFTHNNGTWTPLFDDGIPVLARKDLRSDTNGTLTGKIASSVSGGATFEARLTSSVHGNGTAVSVSNVGLDWSSTMTRTVDCEDLDSDDGRQTAATPAWDELNVEVRLTAGTGTITVTSASVWED